MTPPISLAAPTLAIDELRRRGVHYLAIAGWLCLVMLTLIGVAAGQDHLPELILAGIVANAGPSWMAWRKRFDAEARAVTGTLAAIMPALLVFQLRGHPWQMDGHMYFFVALAALTILCDWRPIILASALIAVHHLAFDWWVPGWVFAGTGNLGRVFFHALAVVLQAVVLVVLSQALSHLFARQDAALEESRSLVAVAEAERRRASEALDLARNAEARAGDERQRHEASERRTAAERRAELLSLAAEFDRSVQSVAITIGTAAGALEASAVRLDDIAGAAGRDAAVVAGVAADATRAIHGVAADVDALGRSIVTIAAAADQQGALTREARRHAAASVETVTHLEDHAVKIEALLEQMTGISSRTSLLALNAAIEAARAGEAGRGFAVVATEVKHLASDAARAGDGIADLVTRARSGVGDTAATLSQASAAVAEVADAAAGIVGAVTDQRSTAASIGTSADRAAASADAIEAQIAQVADAVAAAATLSAEVRRSAGTLLASAQALSGSTQRFVTFLTAA